MNVIGEGHQGPVQPGGGGNEESNLVKLQLLVAVLQMLLVLAQLWLLSH